MLLKWLITGLVVYFLYKTFFSGFNFLGTAQREKNIDRQQTPQEDDKGEYIDYEEVD